MARSALLVGTVKHLIVPDSCELTVALGVATESALEVPAGQLVCCPLVTYTVRVIKHLVLVSRFGTRFETWWSSYIA